MFGGGNCCEADLKDFNAFFIVSVSLSLQREFGFLFFLIEAFGVWLLVLPVHTLSSIRVAYPC